MAKKHGFCKKRSDSGLPFENKETARTDNTPFIHPIRIIRPRQKSDCRTFQIPASAPVYFITISDTFRLCHRYRPLYPESLNLWYSHSNPFFHYFTTYAPKYVHLMTKILPQYIKIINTYSIGRKRYTTYTNTRNNSFSFFIHISNIICVLFIKYWHNYVYITINFNCLRSNSHRWLYFGHILKLWYPYVNHYCLTACRFCGKTQGWNSCFSYITCVF